MSKKQKYYAIKVGNNVTDLIVESWEECEKYVLNVPSRYKSFSTREEAEQYLKEAPDIPQGSFRPYRKGDKVKSEFYLSETIYKKFMEKCKSENKKMDLVIENFINLYIAE